MSSRIHESSECGDSLCSHLSGTPEPFPPDRCIHHLIEAQVARTSNAVAVVCGDRDVTYAELNRQANVLAFRLKELGVCPDDLVALHTERSVDTLVGILGILKAGGAYVPLDPSYPTDRLNLILRDSKPRVLLTQEHLRGRLSHDQIALICLDEDAELVPTDSLASPKSDVQPENLAYVIYTSGSTGKPKGVMISHRNLVHSTWARQQFYEDRVQSFLLLYSFSFDSSVAGIFWTLSQGGTLVVAPQSSLHDPLSVARLVQERRISHIDSVPAMYAVILDQLRGQDVPALRCVIVGGESCPGELVRRHFEYLPRVPLFNEYGPTEATVWSTVFDCSLPVLGHSIPIGKPIPRVAVFLLDEDSQPVPRGTVGELHIGGPGVARGYLHRPDLTDASFIPASFGARVQPPLYRTGDLGRILPDGNIEFLGRVDEQVKIRGFRVELGEIEAALREHSQVGDVVVVAREDTPGVRRLVAYIVPAGKETGLNPGLRSFLATMLPEHMIPSAFVLLEALPQLPNGKVDRRALPPPTSHRDGLRSPYAVPRIPAEETLAEVWRQVLKIDDVGIHDDFVALGGDSLLAMQVMTRANQLGLAVDAEEFVHRPTIASLAEVAGVATIPIHAEQGPVTGPVLLTPVQQQVLGQVVKRGKSKTAEANLDVLQPLDPALLERSLHAVVVHHDALRMRFSFGASGMSGFNATHEDHAIFSHVDLHGLDQREQDAAIEDVTAGLVRRLSVFEGPLLQLAHFDLGSARPARLIQVVDHLVIDGYSEPIVLQDLETAYSQLRSGSPVRLPPKTTSFKYWAERLARYAQSDQLREESDYWLHVLREPVADLPADYPEDGKTKGFRRQIVATLSAEETATVLHDVQRMSGAQIDRVLITAISLAVNEWTGDRSLRLSLLNHGRQPLFDDVDVSRTVGWFTSGFPVLVDRMVGVRPRDVLASVRASLDNLPHHGMGYQMLATQWAQADLPGLPHVQNQLVLNYQGQADRLYGNLTLFALRPPEKRIGSSRPSRGSRELQITARIQDGALSLRFVYHERVYHRETIEALAEGICRALRSLAADCISP